MAKRNVSPSEPQAEVRTCDGQTLKQMIRAGMAWLEVNHEKVNALNVFPVPDGDTGTNMLLTMRNAYKEIAESDEPSAGRIARKTYNGALMGARGNSGVILSQLLLGFANSLDGVRSFTADELVRGLRVASQTADNVRGMKPVEGTILTVARDGATAAEQALGQTRDIRAIMQAVVAEMFRSVDRTPDLLIKDGEYILKKAGVVDSGGMGLSIIMDGMLRCLNGEDIQPSQTGEVEMGVTQESSINLSGLDFPYDVQFLLMGDDLDINEVSRTIEGMGDSALVAGDSKLIKVHVHVTNPGVPLGYAAGIGKITDVVVENMALQYQDFVAGGGLSQSVEPALEPHLTADSIGVVTVAPGEGLTRIFYSLGAGRVISGGQTMNPSTEEIVQAIGSLPSDRVVILPNNKNILLAAQAASQLADGKQVRIVPSATIPQGIAALLALDPAAELDPAAAAMQSAMGHVETGEVTRATRDLSLDKLKVKRGQVIGLHNDQLRVAGDDITQVTLDLLREMGADRLELITLYSGADVTKQSSAALMQQLAQAYPEQTIELQEGSQPFYDYIISAE